MSTNDFLIKFWVNGQAKDSFNGKELTYPIIPRVGDYIDAKYQHEDRNISGVFEVTKVYIHQSGDRIAAQVHVNSD